MSNDLLNLGPALVWVAALSALLSFGTTVYHLLTSGARTNSKTIADHHARMDRHDARISALEQTVMGLPGKDDMHALHLGMSELRGELREMRAVMTGNSQIMGRLESIVTRHEDHLLGGAKR